jgi:hypothetical protein
MLPKHANGKFSHVDLLWEIRMKLGKTFFRGRSQVSQDSRQDSRQDPQVVATKAGAVSPRQFRGLRPTGTAGQVELEPNPVRLANVARPQFGSSNKAPRRTIKTAVIGLTLKGVERCSHGADLILSNFPAGILSWIFAQFFAGCAAYAEAMYPSIAFHQHEDGDRREPLHDGPSQHADSGRSPSRSSTLAPDLREPSRFEFDGGKKRVSLPVASRNQPAAAKSFRTENVVQFEFRRSPAGRLSPIASAVVAWLSRRRRSAGESQTIVELRNHDRRALRGMRLSRYGTE